MRISKKTPESAVLSQVRDYLRLKGWYIIRNQQGMGSHKGLSDLTCIKCGRVVFLEIKAPEHLDKRGRKIPAGKMSEHQVAFAATLHGHGIEYYAIDSLDQAIKINDKEGK